MVMINLTASSPSWMTASGVLLALLAPASGLAPERVQTSETESLSVSHWRILNIFMLIAVLTCALSI
jgi:hypothetical protein